MGVARVLRVLGSLRGLEGFSIMGYFKRGL
jgi:hypothetical protein